MRLTRGPAPARVAGAALALLLLGCSASSGSGEQSYRAVEPVVHGDADTDDAAVVALATFSPCNPAPNLYCTGTLIAPRAVLTAAHCAQPAETVRVFFGNDASTKGTWVQAAAFHAHPDFDASTFMNDVAVLVLAEDAPVAPIPISQTALDASVVGTSARLVGFGIAGEGGSVGAKRTGTMKVTAVEASRFRTEPDPSMSCQIDSGGPVFLTLDGKEALAGITSAGDPLCEQYADNTRVDAFAGFVQPLLDAAADGGVAPPPPTSDAGCPIDDGCQTAGCASGETCNADTGQCEAAPPANAGSSGDDGGCALAPRPGKPAPGWPATVGLVLVALLCRRRSAAPGCRSGAESR